ncbi:MAG: hypothetical protein K9N23_17270 [Akkermansiaceae bacterium]|nr:hypothetical protein [Akkermansiaceae bacterium]
MGGSNDTTIEPGTPVPLDPVAVSEAGLIPWRYVVIDLLAVAELTKIGKK